jgi:glycerol dehydrogenase-like iron-containing ADH family enzyme
MENKKSKGLGDTIAKITKATGIKKAVSTASKIIKKDCGCAKRQGALNRLFPYNN